MIDDAGHTSPKVDVAINRRLDDWIEYFEKPLAPASLEVLQELKKDIDALRFPF